MNFYEQKGPQGSGLGGSGPAPVNTVKRPMLECVLGDLQSEVGALEQQLRHLEERLEPVLAPLTPSESAPKDQKPLTMLPALAAAIRQEMFRVRGMLEAVVEIENRLEL